MKFYISGLVLFFLTASVSFAANHIVVMKSISFAPVKIEIKKGDSVEWDNQSYTEHSATTDESPAKFDTGRVKPKARSKKIILTEAGTYSYRCSVHGKTMSGQIVVAP